MVCSLDALIRLAIMVVWAVLIAIFWSDIAAWMGFSVSQKNATSLVAGLIIAALGCLTSLLMLLVTDGLASERLLWVGLVVSLGCFLLAEFFLMWKLRNLSDTGDPGRGAKGMALL